MTEQQVFGGRYQLETPIGEGGMARVFRAHDARLGRTVALKILREQFTNEQEFVERFRLEARLAAALSHPNIVGVYDVGEDQGLHYMVMEYVEGENLKQLIAREAPMPLDAVIPMVRQLAAALDYAHDHGVIHRDIKPENILLTARREVKVGDFGIARALASVGLTATGTVLGSVSYFSPEQASGQLATAESDLYSAGMVLYEMLTRHVPFSGPNPVAVAMAQVNDTPPSPRTFRPDLSPAVEAVVLKAIAKAPAARFHSGYDMVTALSAPVGPSARPRAAAAASMVTLPNPPVAVSAAPQRPRQGTGGALVALVTTAALLVAAVLVGRSLTSGNSVAGSSPTATASPAATATAPGADSTVPVAVSTATSAAPATATDTPVPPAVTDTPAVGDTATTVPATSTPPVPTDTPAVATATRVPPGSVGTGGASIDLVTAHGVGAHFAPVGVSTSFSTKTPVVYAIALVHHKAKGASVLFRWRYPDGSTYDYLNKVVAVYAGEVTAYAELFPRSAGAYSVTTSINGHQLGSVAFTIVPRSDTPGAPPGQSKKPAKDKGSTGNQGNSGD